MRKVPPQRVAADRIDLKALLQCESTGLETDVHKSCAREVGVGENREERKHEWAIYPSVSEVSKPTGRSVTQPS